LIGLENLCYMVYNQKTNKGDGMSKEGASKEPASKEKAMDLAISSIEKQFGKGAIMRMGGQTCRGCCKRHLPLAGRISLVLNLKGTPSIASARAIALLQHGFCWWARRQG